MGHKPSTSSGTLRDNGQAPVIPATHHTHMTHLRSVIGLNTCIADRDWLMNLAPALMRRVSVSYLYGRSALNVPGRTSRHCLSWSQRIHCRDSSVHIMTVLGTRRPLRFGSTSRRDIILFFFYRCTVHSGNVKIPFRQQMHLLLNP